MPTLTAKIVGAPELNGYFALMNENASTIIDEEDNVTNYNYDDIRAGVKYILIIAVTGPDGKKYKIKVSGVQEAVYPTSEITLIEGRDDIGVLITG